MKEYEEKYIDLLLKRCINFDKSKSLLICYEEDNRDFIDKLVSKAEKLGVTDIYLFDEKRKEKHDILKTISCDEIDNHPLFDKSIWNEYAKKKASFLLFKAEYPGLMEDIEPKKIERVDYVARKTSSEYQKLQMKGEIPWCIAVLHNEDWAKKLFPDSNDSLEKLSEVLYKICLLDQSNPIKSWNDVLKKSNELAKLLDSLEIKSMHYKNSLGTDLTIELTNDTIWNSGATGDKTINNMPTYEVFTSPDYLKTNGIVYSSKPLSYSGAVVDEFYLEFKDGKVVNYDAKKGLEVLKSILETDEYSSYLGEVALINYDSPISNTGIIFGNTLLDENASCHLALGRGFDTCRKDHDNLSDEDLLDRGVSISKSHVDFMIGTDDLEISAETKDGKKLIFKKGNFCI